MLRVESLPNRQSFLLVFDLFTSAVVSSDQPRKYSLLEVYLNESSEMN